MNLSSREMTPTDTFANISMRLTSSVKAPEPWVKTP